MIIRTISRFAARRRAARELEAAKARVATISRQIEQSRKAHKAWRPMLGSLADARRDMLRAEVELRGRS